MDDTIKANAIQPSGNGDRIINPSLGGPTAGRAIEWVGTPKTYYDVPLIHKAHWKWQIVLYFFFGGLAGGSYLVSTLADLLGAREDHQLVRTGRYLSFAGLIVSPILLIWDLGKPTRFLHMLRVLKLRSAMSLGTWGLSLFGLFCGATAVYQAAVDGLLDWLPVPLAVRLLRALPIKVIEVTGSFFGLFVASYTGVLLAATAVPIWARARHILGPLFLTSGISSALASLTFILSLGKQNEAKKSQLERLERGELIALTTELGLISSLPAILGSTLRKPLMSGRTGLLFNVGTLGVGVQLPLILRLFWKLSGRKTPRSLNIVASIMVLIGGVIIRYAWVSAGRTSADDPRATHHYNAIERS
ncbi:polysulfide reductase [Dictyobacter sp. S3.2.2.5]|uniref:Polysulfide reductase n=1 Tax=Dictyobacter halimunensis TaxID=3026934 RepID=A0ABQ6G6V1_9CHLR|nr:polysulfide reductase [Dictyobacter sp. S3.2.2.5]